MWFEISADKFDDLAIMSGSRSKTGRIWRGGSTSAFDGDDQRTEHHTVFLTRKPKVDGYRRPNRGRGEAEGPVCGGVELGALLEVGAQRS